MLIGKKKPKQLISKRIQQERLYRQKLEEKQERKKKREQKIRIFFIRHKKIHKLYKTLIGLDKPTKQAMYLLYKYDNEGYIDKIVRNHMSEFPKRLRNHFALFSHMMYVENIERVLGEMEFLLGNNITEYTEYIYNKYNGKVEGLDSVNINIAGTIFHTVNSNKNIEEIMENINNNDIVLEDDKRNMKYKVKIKTQD